MFKNKVSSDKPFKIYARSAPLNQDEFDSFYITGVPDVITPATMKAYYNFPDFAPGPGDPRPKIGVISLGGYYDPTDLDYYWTNYCNLGTDVRPQVIDHVVGYHGMPLFELDEMSLENTLDIELIGGFCPNADIHFYSALNSYTGYKDGFQKAIDDGMNFISTSWGASEDNFYGGLSDIVYQYNDVFKQAIDNGIIITAATGDAGSSEDDYRLYTVPGYSTKVPVPHTGFPASSPYVVACGGTSLFKDAVDEETAWNYGGGGQSSFFERPDYQGPWLDSWPVAPLAFKKDGLPAARTIPDVAFNADPNSPWTIYFGAEESYTGGTSACAPIMAALLGVYYVLAPPGTAPREGYFGMGFNYYLYASPDEAIKQINYGYNLTVRREPPTNEENPFGGYSDEKNTYYAVFNPTYSCCAGRGTVYANALYLHLRSIVCVARGTRVLMKDGQYKPIEEIKRGDLVIGYGNNYYRVANVNRQIVAANASINMVEFPPNSLGDGYPSKSLFITSNHPIFHKGARRPAKCFRLLPNIIEHTNVQPGTIIPPEPSYTDSDVYVLYDLQFDDDGSYIAEGVTIQSRSPWSDITPLAKHLYFDPSRYRSTRHWDGFNHQLPLDERDILP